MLWPFGIYIAAAIAVVAAMIAVSYLLGERHDDLATGDPYESGIPPTGSARLRFPAQFYLVAMFFVIFDLEAAFLVAWAVAAPELGWLGYAEVVVFVAVLLAALGYLWRIGALDFGPTESALDRGRGREGKGAS